MAATFTFEEFLGGLSRDLEDYVTWTPVNYRAVKDTPER